MANVYIGSDFTITSVNMCTNVAEDVWYQVEYIINVEVDPAVNTMYVTVLNDEKFPKDLAKEDFLANALPEITTYNERFEASIVDDLLAWETEA